MSKIDEPLLGVIQSYYDKEAYNLVAHRNIIYDLVRKTLGFSPNKPISILKRVSYWWYQLRKWFVKLILPEELIEE